MKKILILFGAMALTLTLSMAEGKCSGNKSDSNKTEKKCDSGKCSADKKAMKEAGNKCSGDKKEAKCGGAEKEAPAKGKCGQGKCG